MSHSTSRSCARRLRRRPRWRQSRPSAARLITELKLYSYSYSYSYSFRASAPAGGGLRPLRDPADADEEG
jgi:hypothetical protein